MNSSDSQDDRYESDVDRAVAMRLARLRTRPVDTSRLDKLVRAQLPLPEKTARPLLGWFRPLRAVAASLILLATVAAILLSSSGGQALASPTQMAQMHEDIVAGRTAVMKVDSIAAANQALAEQSPQSPTLPEMPPEHVMACCMQSVQNKKVACVLLQNQGTPVTMTVANAADMKLPAVPTVTKGGVTYRVQAVGKLNMVMTERGGRWVCLIGEASADQLMDLAAKLQF
jgi:hypothetical protein